jgi:hypothetical protein
MEPTMRRVVREELPHAVATVLTSEAVKQFWSIGLGVVKEQAANHAGLWLFGRLGKGISFLMWGALGLFFAYQIAGWAGVRLMLSTTKGV